MDEKDKFIQFLEKHLEQLKHVKRLDNKLAMLSGVMFAIGQVEGALLVLKDFKEEN